MMEGMSRHVQLANLTPRQQLRAGLLPRRVAQLMAGLVLYGVSMAMMIRSTLGLDPWDVFHAGIATHVPLTFGQVTIIVGALVLLLWVPLRQWPGLGTVANVVVIGLAAGPGPRDGLMTGFARRTGLSIRLVRTTIEVVVLSVGWLLGGPVGLGTVLYAVSIGPLVQFFLPRLTVDLRLADGTATSVDQAGDDENAVPVAPTSALRSTLGSTLGSTTS